MAIEIKSLENISIETIHSAFEEAFSGYLVDISYMTPNVMQMRFTKNRLKFLISQSKILHPINFCLTRVVKN